MSGEQNSTFELEDLSATRLIDESYAYENDILSTSIPSILGTRLREMYLNSGNNSAHQLCTDHSNEEICFFCRDCACRLCGTCLLDHDEHDVISHSAAVDEKFDNLAGAVSQSADMALALRVAVDNATNKKDMLLLDKRQLLDSIDDVFLQLQNTINTLKDELVAEVEKVCESYCKECDTSINTWRVFHDTRVKELADMKDNMATLLEERPDIFPLESEIRLKLKKLKNDLPHLKTPQLMKVHVDWNDKLVNLASNVTSAGEVVTKMSIDPFKIMSKFNARHQLDKSPTCIEAMTAQRDGSLALVDLGNLKVKCFSAQGRTTKCFVGGGRFHLVYPTDIVSLTDGRMVICDPGANKVVLFNENGTGADAFGVDAPECVLVNDIGEVGVVCGLNKTLEQIQIWSKNKSQEEVQSIREARLRKIKTDLELQHMGLLAKPRYCARNPVNQCYFIVDPYEHCVFVFSPQGAFMKKYGKLGSSFGELNAPAAVICDKVGQVLVADTLNHRVHLLDPCGNFLRFPLTAADRLRFPKAMCFDEQECLWIAQQDGVVKQFSYAS